jgi:SAM-dependent methyltransferase
MQSLYMNAHALCSKHTLAFLDANPSARFLDLGCYDGDWTKVMAGKIGTRDMYGLEILPEPAAKARAAGIQVKQEDLEKKWPYPGGHFDVVHSSFVIEHMNSIDHFVSELFRVVKPGGYCITTTENGSSWHNIIAAVMGWQTFSSSCCSTKVKGLGNPFALHRGGGESPASMTHKVIFNYLGFKEIFQVHGFKRVSLHGSGYYPLPACVGDWDQRHAHFLVLKAWKS